MSVKQKASRFETSQAEVKLLRQQSENSELAKKQIKVCTCADVAYVSALCTCRKHLHVVMLFILV